MIYLNKGSFVPKVILISIIFAPITIACTLSFLGDFQLPIFMFFLTSLVFYCVGILLAYINSKSKKYAIQEAEGKVIINYPNLYRGSQELVINHDSIVKMEYYRLFSIRSWCMMYNYVLPQCLYLTYICDGKCICNHIGYPDYREICNLCRTLDIELTIK